MRTIQQLTDLAGRKALVTGGTGQLGAVVAETLIELEAQVAVADLDAAACQRQVERLSARHRNGAISVVCDLADEAMTRRAIRAAIDRMGGLDIIVHCAAYVGTTPVNGWACPFEQQTVEAWDAAFRINLTSAFVMVQEAKDALAALSRGSVILFASTYGIVGPDLSLYQGTGMANPVGYGASKGGLLQLTRYLATLLAPRVRINAISLGGVRRDQPELFQRRYQARTPLGRMAEKEDVKGAVAYLASDLSSYVTGHNLVVDGGWTVW